MTTKKLTKQYAELAFEYGWDEADMQAVKIEIQSEWKKIMGNRNRGIDELNNSTLNPELYIDDLTETEKKNFLELGEDNGGADLEDGKLTFDLNSYPIFEEIVPRKWISQYSEFICEAEEEIEREYEKKGYGRTRVSGDARVYGDARVSGDAQVYK